MNILLWVLQIFLALHTVAGAIWKFSNSEASVPSLKAIPHSVWLGLSFLELLCSLFLLAPVFGQRLMILVPIAAGALTLEMLYFCGVHLSSGDSNYGQMMYWLVVAAVCGFMVYGRVTSKWSA